MENISAVLLLTKYFLLLTFHKKSRGQVILRHTKLPTTVASFRTWRSSQDSVAQGPAPKYKTSSTFIMYGGEGGVRTHGTVAGTRDFQSRRFGRSRTSP